MDQSTQIIGVGISVNKNKEFLKPFDLSGAFKVNNMRPDELRDERCDVALPNKFQAIVAQSNNGGIARGEYLFDPTSHQSP